MNKKGLGLVEIIVATVILAITMAGLVNLFISGKRYIQYNRSRMTAGELGKYFLEPLHMDVRQDLWSSNCLGSGSECVGPQSIDGIIYTPVYYIGNDQPLVNLNRVRVDITWTE